MDLQDPALSSRSSRRPCSIRVAAGESVGASERAIRRCEMLVALAEVYDGEHGLAYAAGALDLDAGHDRALQLFTYYARMLGRDGELPSRQLAYVGQNPSGAMAVEARLHALAAIYENAGQLPETMAMLEPIRNVDASAAQKLADLAAACRGCHARCCHPPGAGSGGHRGDDGRGRQAWPSRSA